MVVVLAGCGRVTEDPARPDASAPPPDVAPPDAAVPEVAVVDRSCADVKQRLATSADGVHWIDPDLEDPALRPFQVFCAGMATPAPVEYLELVHTSPRDAAPTSNFTDYVTGATCPCGTVTLVYTKARLDLASMTLMRASAFSVFTDASDLACTASSACRNPLFHFFGAAGSCANINDASGRANVDLRGTPFHVAADQAFIPFVKPAGYMSNGAYAIDSDRKTVGLSGGGHCGGFGALDGVRVEQDR